MEVDDAEVTPSLPTPPCQTGTGHTIPLLDAIGLPSPPRNSKSPVDSVPSSTNPHPTPKPQRGRSQKVPTAPKAPPTLSTTDLFNFSSSSSLTYDSFWSSHTGPTTPQSRRGSHNDSITDYPPTSQTSGSDYNNGIATASHPLNNPVSTSSNIIPQPKSHQQWDFSVPA